MKGRAFALEQARDLEPLIDRIRSARIVMLGESSHGTQEYYEWRRIITDWLITKHGFGFVAVEGDWPPCQAIDDYVRSGWKGGNARQVLESFKRWPTWMWANTEMVRMVEWMKSHNQRRQLKAGFHGLDVYSLFESISEVIERTEKFDRFLSRRVAASYGCFDPYHGDEKHYARSLLEYPEGCRAEVMEALQALLEKRLNVNQAQEGAVFDARQNARIVANAEDYYRKMTVGSVQSWNVRDTHMLETLDVLLDHYGPQSKAVVWAHNTHIGDYRATDMARKGLVSLGGLAREKYGDDAVALVGFGTHRGSVVASQAWSGPTEQMQLPPARSGSLEEAYHRIVSDKNAPNLITIFNRDDRDGALSHVVDHRAVGVVYQGKHELLGNYVPTSLAKRYDAFLYFDETNVLEPLIQSFDDRDVPETYPAGV